MNRSIFYNGLSGKRSFHKIRKYIDILRKQFFYRIQLKEIHRINNSLLNSVIQAVQTVKSKQYNDDDHQVIKNVEAYRSDLLKNENIVTYEIFNSSAERTVKDICKVSASPKTWGIFLYFITKLSNAQKVLEIGTNVGISGSYILHALKKESNNPYFISMEGLEQLCTLSSNQFAKIVNRNEFEIIQGLYEDTFRELVKKENGFDLLFIDGNHQKDPTIQYFNALKKCIKDSAIFVFDDIYYNREMTEAWRIICMDDDVNFSIDMYKLGIIIIDKNEMIKNKSFGLHLSFN